MTNCTLGKREVGKGIQKKLRSTDKEVARKTMDSESSTQKAEYGISSRS